MHHQNERSVVPRETIKQKNIMNKIPEKQKNLLVKLFNERGLGLEELQGLTSKDASKVISFLLSGGVLTNNSEKSFFSLISVIAYGETECPHCGARGNYIYTWAEGDIIKSAMSGCYKKLTKKFDSNAESRFLEKINIKIAQGKKLNYFEERFKFLYNSNSLISKIEKEEILNKRIDYANKKKSR